MDLFSDTLDILHANPANMILIGVLTIVFGTTLAVSVIVRGYKAGYGLLLIAGVGLMMVFDGASFYQYEAVRWVQGLVS